MDLFSKQPRSFVCVMVSLLGALLPAVSGKEACSCYTFHGDLRSWYLSRQHCLDNGGDLVSLETEQEWSKINDEIQKRNTERLGSNEWHIGLTNLTGVWRWINNKSLTYDRWQQGEPEYFVYKPFVTMAKNWPIGMHGLFNSLRGDIPRARICEYKRDCISIKEACRKLKARFAVTTLKPLRLSTVPSTTFITTETVKTNPVFKKENPTSKSNWKNKEKTPFFVVIIVIILGAVTFSCCCIVIVALRWKKKRKSVKKTKDDCHTNNDPPIKEDDSSESINSYDLVAASEDVAYMDRDTIKALYETNGTINEKDSPPTCRPSPPKHDYAEIIIKDNILDDNTPVGKREHRVRFTGDREETMDNCCILDEKTNLTKKDDYALSDNYIMNHCRKHWNGSKENGNLEVTNPMEMQPTEDHHDLDIVKLEVVLPTKEAQYASIVDIYPNEHDLKLKRNKTPFLKTFAPVNGHNGNMNGRNLKQIERNGRNLERNEQNGRNFERNEQNGRTLHVEQNGRNFEPNEQNGRNFERNEQNGRTFEHVEQNGRNFERNEQNGRNFERNEQNGRNFERIEQNGRNFERNEQNGRNFERNEQNGRNFERIEQNDRSFERNEQNGRNFQRIEENGRNFKRNEQNGRNLELNEQNGRNFGVNDCVMYRTADNSIRNRPQEVIYAVVDKSKKSNEKELHPRVQMNYVELAEFDQNTVLYTKMPARYQPTTYTEVEIPNEGD